MNKANIIKNRFFKNIALGSFLAFGAVSQVQAEWVWHNFEQAVDNRDIQTLKEICAADPQDKISVLEELYELSGNQLLNDIREQLEYAGPWREKQRLSTVLSILEVLCAQAVKFYTTEEIKNGPYGSQFPYDAGTVYMGRYLPEPRHRFL
jgi:hypothetical protein